MLMSMIFLFTQSKPQKIFLSSSRVRGLGLKCKLDKDRLIRKKKDTNLLKFDGRIHKIIKTQGNRPEYFILGLVKSSQS